MRIIYCSKCKVPVIYLEAGSKIKSGLVVYCGNCSTDTPDFLKSLFGGLRK